MNASAGPWRRGLLIPSLTVFAALMVLIGLGIWQTERKAWKEGLIGTLTRRLAAPPIVLPAPDQWSGLDQAENEFRHVTFRAEIFSNQEAPVYTSGSAFRPDISGPGYWIFAPAKIANSGVVVINRGFVPEGRQDPKTRAEGQVIGPLDIVGVLRWPEAPGLFTPADDPSRNLWFTRNPVAIAQAKQWGAVAPFYVEQEVPIPSGGLPKPGALQVSLPNNHLQYAVTWFGLAGALVAVFGFWARSRMTASL
ncbi:MAG: surfeit locus 1 family protein [Alphaproteobacteria bacterium]|nr:surfeit locus 1 family protein [Alphaproteobacteria bacterium]